MLSSPSFSRTPPPKFFAHFFPPNLFCGLTCTVPTGFVFMVLEFVLEKNTSKKLPPRYRLKSSYRGKTTLIRRILIVISGPKTNPLPLLVLLKHLRTRIVKRPGRVLINHLPTFISDFSGWNKAPWWFRWPRYLLTWSHCLGLDQILFQVGSESNLNIAQLESGQNLCSNSV